MGRFTRKLILPLISILTDEDRDTIPASLLASQEYSPLSSSTTFSIERKLLSPAGGLTCALEDTRAPFFNHLISVVTSLTSQVSLSSSPTISVGCGFGVMSAVGFSEGRQTISFDINKCPTGGGGGGGGV